MPRSAIPGVPVLIREARAVVSRERRVRIQATLLGLGASVLLGAPGAYLLEGIVFIAALAFVWPLVGLSCHAFMSPDPELVKDAQAVLEAWEGTRDEWAALAVAELSAADAAEETAAWARISAEKAELFDAVEADATLEGRRASRQTVKSRP